MKVRAGILSLVTMVLSFGAMASQTDPDGGSADTKIQPADIVGRGACYDRYLAKKTPPPGKYSVSVHGFNFDFGSTYCVRTVSGISVADARTQAIASCKRRPKPYDSGCHVVMINGKWVATAADFSRVPSKVFESIRRNHQYYERQLIRKRAATMSPDELLASFKSGQMKPDQAFDRFNFNLPLQTSGVPSISMMALTRFGQPEPDTKSNPWLQNRSARALKTLTRSEGLILIAPTQTIGYAFDQAHRIALDFSLAGEVSQRTGLQVYDPSRVRQALALGQNAVSMSSLAALADQLKARAVLVPSVGHDNAGTLFVRVELLTQPATTGDNTDRLPTSASELLAERVQFLEANGVLSAALPLFERVGQQLRARNISALSSNASGTKRASTRLLLPLADQLAQTEPNDLSGALTYQWLAAMVPDEMVELQSSLLARSLVILNQLQDSSNTASQLMRARALAQIRALPAARTVLSSSDASELKAYLAFTNGQIGKMQTFMQSISDPELLVLLQTDLARLLKAAEVQDKLHRREVNLLAYAQSTWAPLLEHRLLSGYARKFPTNATLISAIPVAKANAKAKAVKISSDQRANSVMDRAVINSLRIAQNENRACAEPAQYCPRLAYLEVLEALSMQAALNPVSMLVYKQGLPKEGHRYMMSLDPMLKGAPYFERRVADVVSTLLKHDSNPEPDEKTALQLRLKEALSLLKASNSVANKVYKPRSGSKVASLYRDFQTSHLQDYPPPPYWGSRMNVPGKDQSLIGQRELDYLSFSLRGGLSAVTLNNGEFEQELANRFSEHYAFVASHSRALNQRPRTPENVSQVMEYAQRIITLKPHLWVGYRDLAFAKARDINDSAGAARAFLRYPAFHESRPENPVSVSNRASRAGDYFFWRGDMKNARVFYNIVNRLATGSEGNMSAVQRIALMDGDYLASLQAASNRVSRYNSSFGLRDTLSWMFVLGEEKQAWNIFQQVHGMFGNGQPWLSAQIGARHAGFTWQQNIKWLSDPTHNEVGRHRTPFAAITATGLALMDRQPDPQAAAAIGQLGKTPGLPPSHWSEFTEAMTALLNDDPAIAFDKFKQIYEANVPAIGLSPEAGVMLPYATYAAIRSGNAAQAWAGSDADIVNMMAPRSTRQMKSFTAKPPETRIVNGQVRVVGRKRKAAKVARPRPTQPKIGFLRRAEYGSRHATDFDFELSQAFQTGLAGKTAHAVKHLQTALNYMPYALTRPIHPEYQWAEACEWLYRDTGEAVFRDMAVSWAVRYQTVVPYLSWPYAIEASLTTDPDRKLRAVSFGLALDPHSRRLNALPEKLRRQARDKQFELPWVTQLKAVHENQDSRDKI